MEQRPLKSLRYSQKHKACPYFDKDTEKCCNPHCILIRPCVAKKNNNQ